MAGLLEERQVELVDIMYRRETGGRVLRLVVDKEGGITLDECAYLNKKLGEALDREEVMPERYFLEVSSPGLDRPLRTKRDFEKAVGKTVRIHTYEPIDNKKDHEGIVESVDEDKVRLGGTEIKLDKISKAKIKI